MVRRLSPERGTVIAACANAGIAATQGFAGVISGNLGFIVEAAHNVGDAIAYAMRRGAMDPTVDKTSAMRLRQSGAGIMLAGGTVGAVGGFVNTIIGNHEIVNPAVLSFAIGATAVNAATAAVAYYSRDSDPVDGSGASDHAHGGHSHHHHHHHHHRDGAHRDTKAHTIVDAMTGLLYTGGLLFEERFPGIANYAVIAAGVAYLAEGRHMLGDINNDHKR